MAPTAGGLCVHAADAVMRCMIRMPRSPAHRAAQPCVPVEGLLRRGPSRVARPGSLSERRSGSQRSARLPR